MPGGTSLEKDIWAALFALFLQQPWPGQLTWKWMVQWIRHHWKLLCKRWVIFGYSSVLTLCHNNGAHFGLAVWLCSCDAAKKICVSQCDTDLSLRSQTAGRVWDTQRIKFTWTHSEWRNLNANAGESGGGGWSLTAEKQAAIVAAWKQSAEQNEWAANLFMCCPVAWINGCDHIWLQI